MTVTLARSSFESYVSARSGVLLRFAYVLCGDRHLAEDLVQEVLIRAHRRWSAIEAENPDGYLKRALVRSHISWRRRRSSTEVASDAIPDGGRAAGFDEEFASREELWTLLGKLSPAQRSVLVLRYFEDLDDQRIAQLVGATQSTVRVHAHRGLARLRELVAPADSAQALARVAGLPEALARRAGAAPAAKPYLVNSVRDGAARAARRRRVAVGMAGAGLAALLALLLFLPNLWRSGHDIPPTQPTPTTTPSSLPTSTLELMPVERPAPPTFPYVLTALPEGFGSPRVDELSRPDSASRHLRLSYETPGGGTWIHVNATSGPYASWDLTDATIEATTIAGVAADLRHNAMCSGVSWAAFSEWLTVITCQAEVDPDDRGLSIDELIEVAEGIVPGNTPSSARGQGRIASVSLPVGYVVHYADQWGENSVCASPDPGLTGVCVSVESIEPGSGSRSPLLIDGHPGLDWVNSSPLNHGPLNTLTVYLDEYKVHVATGADLTLGDRIAIYRSVVLNE